MELRQPLHIELGRNPSTIQKTTPDSVIHGKYRHIKGMTMVLLGAVLWGVSGTAAQVLFQRDGFNPAWLVSVRMTTSGLLLLIALTARFGFAHTFAIWKNKRDAFGIVLLGIIGLLGVQYSYFASIRYGNAATGTLLQYLGPIFITIYVALRRRQIPSVKQLTAVLIALLGVLFLVTNGNWHSLSIAPLAVIWGFISAITLAFYTLYPAALLRTYGASTVMGWGMFIGGIGMSLMAPPWTFSGYSAPGTWFLVGFVTLFGTLLAFYIYIASLKYISASEASLLACGEPLSATILTVAALHVPMSCSSILGAICILTTVTILARSKSEQSI
ncbi:DMT family transporter [Alicyclobacillus suci]|uniref:DMT family transporter n=1 Tax=Alicyclobacillus suci TaxID=2816080 RepID=UPI002E285706|nr:DMT family transporter [Alicyclobacillus suci]